MFLIQYTYIYIFFNLFANPGVMKTVLEKILHCSAGVWPSDFLWPEIYYVAPLQFIAEHLREHGGKWVLQGCCLWTVQRSSAEAGPGRSSAPPCLPYRCTNHAISLTLHPPPAPQTLDFNIWKKKMLRL